MAGKSAQFTKNGRSAAIVRDESQLAPFHFARRIANDESARCSVHDT